MPNGNKRSKSKNRRAQRPGTGRPAVGAAQSSARQQPANAKRNYERYMALAKDAEQAGDPIQSENYYQHAEHYLRVMLAANGNRGAQTA